MLPALSLLASCSDSAGEGQAQTPTGNAPKPAGTVDMSDLLKAGALPENSPETQSASEKDGEGT